MYYLQSRYYDPEMRRFINADDPEIIEELSKNTVLGSNMFAYCENDSVNGYDPDGRWKKSAHYDMCVNANVKKLSYSDKKAIGTYDKACDEKFASTNAISYPFHSRGIQKTSTAISKLYSYSVSILKSNKKKSFTYDELFSKKNGYWLNCYDKKKNSSCTTDVAKKANNQIKDYINSPKTAKEQSLLLMGLCMHIAQDYYAHQYRVFLTAKGKKIQIMSMTDADAAASKIEGCTKRCELEDDPNVLSRRYNFAISTTKDLLYAYADKKKLKSVSSYANGHNTFSYENTKKKVKLNSYVQTIDILY